MGGGAALAGGVLGAIGGGQEDVSSTSSRIILPRPSEFEKTAFEDQKKRFREFSEFTDLGPGREDVTRGLQAQRELADFFGQRAQGPSLLLSRGQDVAQQLFAPQRLAISQAFEQAGVQTSRLSAQLGRQTDDPILRAKLAQAQAQQTGLLASQQQATSLQLGRQFGQEQFASQERAAVGRARILGGLGQQATESRLRAFQVGRGIIESERRFNLARAGQESITRGGGGLKGAIAGGLAGAGAGLGAAGQFAQLGQIGAPSGGGGFGGGGGGGFATPTFASSGFQTPRFGQSAAQGFGGPTLVGGSQFGPGF